MEASPCRRGPVGRGLSFWLAALLLAAVPTRAQDADLPPVTRTFAIENARVVQAPGRVIERGTVVVRDGLITAVGADVAVPFDADRIAGDSLVVYAGFIDGLSHAGVPKPEEQERDRSVKPGSPPYDVAGIQPEQDVRALLDPSDDRIEDLRAAGFTAAHVVPHGRMLPGQGAVILLGGDAPGAMVLQGGTSLFAQFEGARGVYPATPMAVMATMRQLYREAEIRRGEAARYADDPAGRPRPAYDAVHEALFPVVAGERPVFFYTEGSSGALEIHRALQLHETLGFPLVLAGLEQAFAAVDALRDADVPLFLTLGLPEAPDDDAAADTTARTEPDSLVSAIRPDDTLDVDPDSAKAVTPGPAGSFFVRDLRTRSFEDVEAETRNLEARRAEQRAAYVGTAAKLHEAGLRFGFTTLDVDADDVHAHLREMVAAGLSEDAALAALTTDAADLLGLSRQLGTVEAGKIGNLVVTTGPLFAEDTDVRYVFVDGRRYEIEAEPARGGGAATVNPVGTWSIEVDTPDGPIGGTLTITGTPGDLGGTLSATVLPAPIPIRRVAVDGDVLTFSYDAGELGSYDAELTIEGDELDGTFTSPQMGGLPVTGTRTSGPDGR